MSIETTGDYALPSSPSDRNKIKDALHEIVEQMCMIDGYKDNIKEIQDRLKEEFMMPTKITNKLAKTLHKHEYEKVAQEQDAFSIAYETLFQMGDSGDDTEQED